MIGCIITVRRWLYPNKYIMTPYYKIFFQISYYYPLMMPKWPLCGSFWSNYDPHSWRNDPDISWFIHNDPRNRCNMTPMWVILLRKWLFVVFAQEKWLGRVNSMGRYWMRSKSAKSQDVYDFTVYYCKVKPVISLLNSNHPKISLCIFHSLIVNTGISL